jgi:hypothetical protein
MMTDRSSLTGELPSELGFLTSLTSINLSKLSPTAHNEDLLAPSFVRNHGSVSHFVFLPPDENSLTGSLPTELGALSELKYLLMCKCDEQVEVMNRKVSHLVFLPPDGNSFTGSLPTELGALRELQRFDLSKSHESTS